MIYLDASVVVSLHFRDANTPAALALVGAARAPLARAPLVGAPMLISALCELEAVNAFGLRVFRKEMQAVNRDNAVRDLESDIRTGVLRFCAIPEGAFARAKTLAQSLTPAVGVRAAGLLHVAVALELGARSFYTFDRKQHKAAEAAGLKVNRLG